MLEYNAIKKQIDQVASEYGIESLEEKKAIVLRSNESYIDFFKKSNWIAFWGNSQFD